MISFLQKLFNLSVPKNIVGIYADTLEFGLYAAKSTHPNEFIGVMITENTENGNVISEIQIIPGTQTSGSSAVFPSVNVPISTKIAGTFHSHPSGTSNPSIADLDTFSRGVLHIIASHPYTKKDWKAYSASGDEIDLPVIEDQN